MLDLELAPVGYQEQKGPEQMHCGQLWHELFIQEQTHELFLLRRFSRSYTR